MENGVSPPRTAGWCCCRHDRALSPRGGRDPPGPVILHRCSQPAPQSCGRPRVPSPPAGGWSSVTLISVVIPVYEVQGYLRQCLDSIFDQSFTDLEVIAVDDKSPDGSGRILAEYAAREPRLRVIALDENVGQGPARNMGLDQAVG